MTDQPTTLSDVLLAMGFSAGGLIRPEVVAELVDKLQTGTLNPAYVVFLRNRLTWALHEAGVEGGPPEAS